MRSASATHRRARKATTAAIGLLALAATFAAVTPAHGTACDITGCGIANTQAIQHALAIAARMDACTR